MPDHENQRELETAGPKPLTPEQAAAFDRLKAINDQLEIWHKTREIALDQSLLSHAAIRRIRRLYQEFDAKHPNTTEEGQP
ncbi:hypothetical protein DSM43518_04803 [Mycobacterium marinum]|nr:hypothetical protein [Mycobacterium marinum]AXN51261.1 hypothetical protein CCUG20998_03865 [Mycobacterium marinum]RFZ02816.1 hypothetical protein DSM43518_04803 [Mycobacterium marinum]RFZ26007.1 hypothetical protein DSM43519_01321 [Mycobacterium marinum]RFZ28886.1 hypothetical protein DSM44344_01153 [Mycobacterium marinum]RFZ39072.1 hypothetical protein NCTC2275_00340 [Mycobacterium marinum]